MSLVRGAPSGMFSEWSGPLEARLEQLAPSADVVVMIGEPSLTHSLPKSLRTPVIVDKSNVLTASGFDALRTYARLKPRMRTLMHLPMVFLFERRTVKSAEAVWVTSQEERARLRKFHGQDASILKSAAPAASAVDWDGAGRTWSWMSTFAYEPNWDGLTRILSALDADRPAGFKMNVIGANASPEQIAHLRRYSFVNYLGFQPDLTAALQGSVGAVVPVWSGAGVKLKTLTLMAMGMPVIATPVALEGIPQDTAAAVAHTPKEFSRHIANIKYGQLLEGRAAGLRYAREDLSPEQFKRSLRDLLVAVVG